MHSGDGGRHALDRRASPAARIPEGGGGRNRGARLDGEAWTVYTAFDVPIPSPYINDFLEASDGALWMAGLGQEAVRLDFGTSRWATYEGLSKIEAGRMDVEAKVFDVRGLVASCCETVAPLAQEGVALR